MTFFNINKLIATGILSFWLVTFFISDKEAVPTAMTTPVASGVSNPFEDYEELGVLYSATGGINWVDNTQWDFPSSFLTTNWFGITLGVSVDCVVCLDLDGIDEMASGATDCSQIFDDTSPGNNLIGTLPPDLVLPSLEYLSLDGNVFDNIPNFSNLPSLFKLSLANCTFTDTDVTVPDFQNLMGLQELRLHDSGLSGTIPDYTNLDLLTIDNNEFDSLPVLSNLSWSNLSISNNLFIFDNILPNMLAFNGDSTRYAPQKEFFKDTLFTFYDCQNVSIDLEIDAAISTSTYYWYQNGILVDSTESNTKTFTNITDASNGEWHVEVTNPGAPGLTLMSHTFDINVISFSTDGCYADLRFSAFDPFDTLTGGTISNLVMPDHENFAIDYLPNDTLLLQGGRANNFMGQVTNNYTQDYLNLVNNDSSDIPAILLRSRPGETSEISFDLSAGNPANFDFAIWDLDRRDSCKIEVYNAANDSLDVDPFVSAGSQGGLFDATAPLAIWDPLNDLVHAAPGDQDGYRNYFVLRFNNTPISRISITYYGVSNISQDSCILNEINAVCPNLFFSIYVRDIELPNADAGPEVIISCDDTATLNVTDPDPGSNISYSWTGPNFSSTDISPSVSEPGEYILTANRDDGVCCYIATDTVDVFFSMPDSTFLPDLTSCNPIDTGLVVNILPNQFDCDSTIFQYTALLDSDSTFLPDLTSCNPIDTGLIVTTETNYLGCDSTIFQHTTLLPSSEEFINLTSCNPIDTGFVITIETNYLECDSIIQTYTTLPHYAHLMNDSISTFLTNTDIAISNLVLPGNDMFNIECYPMDDTIFLSGSRANNYIAGPSNDYTASYLSLVDNSFSDIPALLLRNKTGNTSKLAFDLSAGNPDNFDFTIWDIDEKDSCKIQAYGIDGLPLGVNDFNIIQGSLFDPNPLSEDNVIFLNDSTIYVAAYTGDTTGDRSYFTLRFVDFAVSRIEVTYYGENQNCDILAPNAAFCPNVLFSLYVPNPEAPIANAGSPPILGCEGVEVQLDGSGSDIGGNTSYIWTGPDNFTSTELNPLISVPGQYQLTVSLDDGFCEYMAIDNVSVILQESEPNFESAVICMGESVEVCGMLFDNSGNYEVICEEMAFNGCDSLVLLSLTVEEFPILVNDTFYVQLEDLPLTGDLKINDELSDDNEWIFTINDDGMNGQINYIGDGSFIYDGGPNNQLFEYEVCSDACPNTCDTALVWIEVDSKDCYAPDILTPNNDGFNDVLWINCLEDPLQYPKNKLMVINRWGDPVYQVSPYTNNSWYGQNQNGGLLPSGVYYILLDLDIGSGEQIRKEITILR